MSADRLMLTGLLALCVGCGSLADGGYRGEVLMEVAGHVLMDGTPTTDDLGVAVLWSRMEDAVDVEAQSVVVSTSFPASYEVRMYHPPESTMRLDLFGIPGFRAAVGEIIVFEDDDHDDRWTPDEVVVGGSFDATVLWVEDPGSVPAPNGGWFPNEGFNLVQRADPFSCTSPWNLFLEERPIAETDLFVGAYWPASFDWDCDGQPDFLPEVSPAFGCAEHPVEQDCQMLEEQVGDPQVLEGYVEMLSNDPSWSTCLDASCPDVLDAVLEAVGHEGMPSDGSTR